jgi:hypothetical protein
VPKPKQLYGVLLRPIARERSGIQRSMAATWHFSYMRAVGKSIEECLRALIDRRIDGLLGFLLILPTLCTPVMLFFAAGQAYYFIDGIHFAFNAIVIFS